MCGLKIKQIIIFWLIIKLISLLSAYYSIISEFSSDVDHLSTRVISYKPSVIAIRGNHFIAENLKCCIFLQLSITSAMYMELMAMELIAMMLKSKGSCDIQMLKIFHWYITLKNCPENFSSFFNHCHCRTFSYMYSGIKVLQRFLRNLWR